MRTRSHSPAPSGPGGRWLQWKDQVLPPEGESRHDHWILAELFLRVRELYRSDGGAFPDPVTIVLVGVLALRAAVIFSAQA
jgi:anaerobic selenocysteine-containing dehydrogenase